MLVDALHAALEHREVALKGVGRSLAPGPLVELVPGRSDSGPESILYLKVKDIEFACNALKARGVDCSR